MRENTNPLDNIRIASPCGAGWNKMYGSERKRFCAECKLNVYNISEMTQEEAENLIIKSEGRLCLRLYRRADGTVITQNCPVGWARVKRRASLACKAALGIAGGVIAGLFGLGAVQGFDALTREEVHDTVFPASSANEPEVIIFGGTVEPRSLESVGVKILTSRF